MNFDKLLNAIYEYHTQNRGDGRTNIVDFCLHMGQALCAAVLLGVLKTGEIPEVYAKMMQEDKKEQ